MKLISATLLPLVLLTGSAIAEPSSRCKSPAPVQALTPQPAPAPACKTDDEARNTEQRNLETCDADWQKELKDHNDKLERATAYRNYYDKWRDSPAQRPPKLPIPELTRASYRQYMASCLRDRTAMWPGSFDDK
jgi:hypothetical protein